MKSRKKIILPSKPVLKRSDSNIEKTRPEKKFKRKNFSSELLQQNLEFFHKQSTIFQRPFYNGGDADSYFKNTLRNYEYFDFSPFRSKSNYFVKTSKSLDNLKKKKSVKSITTILKPKKNISQSKQDIKNTKMSELNAESKESDDVSPSPEDGDPASKNEPKTDEPAADESAADGPAADEPVADEPAANEPAAAEEPAADAPAGDEPKDTGKDSKIDESTMDESKDTYYSANDFTTDESTVETDEDTDEMKEVEKMIKQASQELAEVAEENQQLLGLANEGEKQGEGEKPAGGDGGSFFKFDPAIDAAVLKELEEAEKQAKETAKVINELKSRLTELLKKEKHTETEAKELEEKNKELRTQMILFEEKTKRIQSLIAQTNLFENMIPPTTPIQMKHNEDVLPKVIVCGMTEHNIPKLILCDDKKRKTTNITCPAPPRASPCYQPKSKDVNIPMSVVPKFAKRLSDSYTMQEKLAAENADLEGMRYKLQSDLLNKDQTIEYLQRKLCSIQCEMRMLCKENTILNDRIQQVVCNKPSATKHKRPCGKNNSPSPCEIENRLNEYSETTKLLEKQLCDMENDVKAMQGELTAVQAEREHLEQHKKIIICPPLCVPHQPCVSLPPPCSPLPCGQPPCGQPPCGQPPCGQPPCGQPPCGQPPCGQPLCGQPPCGQAPCRPPPCVMPCPAFPSPIPSCTEQQLRELREQYCRLQDDFKSKVTEVGGLRADNEKLKATVKNAEEQKKSIEDRLKEVERQLKTLKNENNKHMGSKEQLIEQEQQLAVAKQRFREAQDELEELRAFVEDQQSHLDDYRNKYLEAQQEVEEQKRRIDILEMDANRVSEQVNLEIQKVKNQFQEKLQELLPLPDLLKTTQIKLQEAQQMHLLAERNNEALNRDLQMYKDKIAEINSHMEKVRSDQELGEGEKQSVTAQLKEAQDKINELQNENDDLKSNMDKSQEALEESEREVQTKLHEIAQLTAQLESVREESARQVARNKERCETVRRSMQNQVSDLERQLAQSRAQARTIQKDRDEIRQKMQAQISNLHENFEDAQMRIRNLQGHVNFLKDSYNSPLIPIGDVESTTSDQHDCTCGMEF